MRCSFPGWVSWTCGSRCFSMAVIARRWLLAAVLVAGGARKVRLGEEEVCVHSSRDGNAGAAVLYKLCRDAMSRSDMRAMVEDGNWNARLLMPWCRRDGTFMVCACACGERLNGRLRVRQPCGCLGRDKWTRLQRSPLVGLAFACSVHVDFATSSRPLLFISCRLPFFFDVAC